MTTTRTTEQLREDMNYKKLPSGDRIAVIVTVPFSKRKQDLGVQFWTKEMIQEGYSTNTDNTISKFVEIY
jgi:hypothetical protein